jgi:hypothetical protein
LLLFLRADVGLHDFGRQQKMPRGPSRLNVCQVSVHEIERAVRDVHNIRVGATGNPLLRASSYESEGVSGRHFVGTFLYCQARNARVAEDRLLAISRNLGRARLNSQWRSNYADRPGYVYVILGRPLPPGGMRSPQPYQGCVRDFLFECFLEYPCHVGVSGYIFTSTLIMPQVCTVM